MNKLLSQTDIEKLAWSYLNLKDEATVLEFCLKRFPPNKEQRRDFWQIFLDSLHQHHIRSDRPFYGANVSAYFRGKVNAAAIAAKRRRRYPR